MILSFACQFSASSHILSFPSLFSHRRSAFGCFEKSSLLLRQVQEWHAVTSNEHSITRCWSHSSHPQPLTAWPLSLSSPYCQHRRPCRCWVGAPQLQAGLQDPVATVHAHPARILHISTSGSSARSLWEGKHPSGFGPKARGHVYHPRCHMSWRRSATSLISLVPFIKRDVF